MAITITYPGGVAPFGSEAGRIVLSSLGVGDEITLSFQGGGDSLVHVVASAVVATEHTNLKNSIDAFVASHSSDGFWSTVSDVITDGTKIDVIYSDSIGHLVGSYDAAPVEELDPLFTIVDVAA